MGRIAYRVQHAAGREGVLDRLLPLLPPAVEVITDEGAREKLSPWRGYRRCFEDLPLDASHVVIVQDDARACRNFGQRLEQAVDEKPNDVISLFVGGLPGRTRKNFLEAQGRGERWSQINFQEIHHVVCLCWPISLAKQFIEWIDQNKIPGP